MYCKFCGAELEENTTLCAGCGKDNKESKKRTPWWLIVIAAVCCVVLLAALGAMVYYGLYGTLEPKANDLYYKENYTAEDDKLVKKLDKTVVTMGEAELTNAQLQVFYWQQIYDYGYQYSYYYGLDLDKPLNEQILDEETGKTWQQYFLECALINWQQLQTLTSQADAAGFTLPEDYQQELNSIETTLAESAQEGGYASVEEMLAQRFGPDIGIEEYKNYCRLLYTGSMYFSELVDQIEVTQEEMDAYFAEYGSSMVTSWSVAVTKNMGKLVDVRHILIQPEGGTKDDSGNTTYTDDEWEACRVKAQEIYDEWLAGDATETTFSEAAYKNSADSNYGDGGLYTDISKGVMVSEFENWCFDESRKAGDHGLVKTPFGYHIMYFVGSEDGYVRYCTDGVLSGKADEMLMNIVEEAPMEVNYKAIVLSDGDLSAE